MSEKKTGKNSLCPCNSGLQYKYCCIGKEIRPVQIPIKTECDDIGLKITANFTNDILNTFATAQLPLKIFCKDNDLYFFSSVITLGDAQELEIKLKNKILTKQDILNTFKNNFKKELVFDLLKRACKEMEIFHKLQYQSTGSPARGASARPRA